MPNELPRTMPGDERTDASVGEQLALLRALADRVPAMLAYWDSSERCRFANRAYETWFGIAPEEIVGLHMRDLLGPLYELNLPHIQGALRGEPQHFDRDIPDPAGGPPRRSQAHYIPDVREGVVHGFAVLVTDVSERSRAAEAIHRAEQELGLAIDNAPIAMALVRLDGGWMRVNRLCCELLGYPAAELLQLTFQDVTHPDDLDIDIAHVGELLAGRSSRYELAKRYIRKDGVTVDAMLHVSIVRDDQGNPRHFISQIVDLTERKRLQERVMRADRMASVGTLAAGVAHELNNPLAYVMTNLELLTAGLAEVAGAASAPQLGELLELAKEASDGAARVRDIVRGLKSFARPDQKELRPVDLIEALKVSLRLSANETRHRARVVTRLGAVPRVKADEGRLAQVFVNLIVNAAHAIPEGQVQAHQITVSSFSDAAGRAVVEVRDTGHGIPGELVGRIFEPFFTTRDVGVGTGLGLSISHGIVTSFGGELLVESEVGVGTTMRVVLPASPPGHEAAPEAPTTAAATPTGGARVRVLVVDDEPMLARAVARALVKEHDVTTATSGKAALALVLTTRFDAIISDVMMPEMTGIELYQAMRAQSPGLEERMIFISGGALTERSLAFLATVSNPLLEKPLDTRKLKGLLSELAERAAFGVR